MDYKLLIIILVIVISLLVAVLLFSNRSKLLRLVGGAEKSHNMISGGNTEESEPVVDPSDSDKKTKAGNCDKDDSEHPAPVKELKGKELNPLIKEVKLKIKEVGLVAANICTFLGNKQIMLDGKQVSKSYAGKRAGKGAIAATWLLGGPLGPAAAIAALAVTGTQAAKNLARMTAVLLEQRGITIDKKINKYNHEELRNIKSNLIEIKSALDSLEEPLFKINDNDLIIKLILDARDGEAIKKNKTIKDLTETQITFLSLIDSNFCKQSVMN